MSPCHGKQTQVLTYKAKIIARINAHRIRPAGVPRARFCDFSYPGSGVCDGLSTGVVHSALVCVPVEVTAVTESSCRFTSQTDGTRATTCIEEEHITIRLTHIYINHHMSVTFCAVNYKLPYISICYCKSVLF